MMSARTRLACTSCTRRKVKCSKTVPCANCIRRGEQDTCLSDATTPDLNSPAALGAEQREVESLRSRIIELESAIQTQSNGTLDRSDTSTPTGYQRVSPPSETSDPVVEDAASILEFLAWGRRKNPEYNSVISPEASADIATSSGDIRDDQSFLHAIDDVSQIAPLQLLLPTKRQLLELIHYHQECLLWFHCSFHAPTFRSQVEIFYDRFHGAVESRAVNLQWLALLFAVITGSITCAPNNIAQAWGFRSRERETLSRRWFRAVYTCLNVAEYAANQSILSVQAISTLTISAHLLGFSNIHSIHLAAVIRIAQGLGLHRIVEESSGASVDKESGRRLWSQLCCQDWFSIPFSDTYLINPLHSQSAQPLNCHDKDMNPLPVDIPTITTYCRLLTRIASIMPQLQDDIMSCNTPFTKYEQVLKWDKQMRAISTSERPLFLSNIPIEPSWPSHIAWARRSLAITCSHKIIMIHRSFLSESFTNPVFSFTRRTCLAASKTIIKEFKSATIQNDPILWTHQAFSVAASIILLLDVLHRNSSETEYSEHRRLAQDTIEVLKHCRNSMIATRGVELLTALLQAISESSQAYNSRKRRHDRSEAHTNQYNNTEIVRRGFSVPAFVKSFCNGKKQTSITTIMTETRNITGDALIKEGHTMIGADHPLTTTEILDAPIGQYLGDDMPSFLPGLEGATPFENLLYLANHDFT